MALFHETSIRLIRNYPITYDLVLSLGWEVCCGPAASVFAAGTCSVVFGSFALGS